ncbi:MAG: hypothetical protein ACM3KM_02945 [Acidobacteriaceae bacterium]
MKKTYWITAIIVVAVIVAGYFVFVKKGVKNEENPGQNQEQQQSKNDENKPAGTFWTGQLKASDNEKKGNLMLFMPQEDQTIYIHTSRDYSALLDKDVYVTYEGDLTNFKLLDIKAK